MPSEKRLQVTIVNAGGNAEAAGVLLNDILDEMDGITLNSSKALDAAIDKNKDGANLSLYRNGVRINIPIPSGKMGVFVIEVEFDPEVYFLEQEFHRRLEGMMVTTAPSIEGYRVTKCIDIVTSECVFGLNAFKDFFMGLTDFFGGRSGTAQTALRDARKACLYELKKEAAQLGANAVIGIDLDYSEFSGKGTSMLFLVASGTAVFVEKTTS